MDEAEISRFLEDALARDVIDAATYRRLHVLVGELAATPIGSAHPIPLPMRPDTMPASSTLAPARQTSPARVGPAPVPTAAGGAPKRAPASERGWTRIRSLIASDLAIHGLTYLGVLLLFAGTFGFMLFSFTTVRVGLRPLAEAGLPLVLLVSAGFLRRRGAPFVATAVGLVGGLLLPATLFASFVDGIAFPPELTGSALIAGSIVTSLALAAGYAAYTSRHDDASTAYLVAPMCWIALWALGFAFDGRDEVVLQRWSPVQLAAVTLAVTASAVFVRARPRTRLLRATERAAELGAPIAYVVTLVVAAGSAWPAGPLVVAGLATLGTIEMLSITRRAPTVAAIAQVAVIAITIGALVPTIGTAAAGAVCALSFLALAEWHAQRRPSTVAAAAVGCGIATGLAATITGGWSAVIAFGVASAWAHGRRLHPLAGWDRDLLTVGAAALPLGGVVGLIAATSASVALESSAVATLVIAVAARMFRPDDELYRWWIPATGVALVACSFQPAASHAAAAMADLAVGFALVLSPNDARVRVWSSGAAFATGAWWAAVASGVGVGDRLAVAGALGAGVVVASTFVRRPIDAHLGGIGLVMVSAALLRSPAGAIDTIALTTWVIAWVAVVVAAEAVGRGVGPALTRAAHRASERTARVVAAVPSVIAASSLPILVVDLAHGTGVVTGHRSWVGLLLALLGFVYGTASVTLGARKRVARVLSIAAFTLGLIAISVAAPDGWPSAGALALLIATVWSVGGELRTATMRWTGWVSSGALVVLLAHLAGSSARWLPIVAIAWGAVLLVAPLAVDAMRCGRRSPGEAVRNEALRAPVAIGALAVPVGLALTFGEGPEWYGAWSIVVAGVYLIVALQLRAGSVSTVSVALVTFGVGVMLPTAPTQEPALFLPFACIGVAVSTLLGRWNRQTDPWLRWDLAPLVVAHAVGVLALIVAVSTDDLVFVWTALGVLSLVVSALRRHVAWAAAGVSLLTGAAADAGAGWLALALAADGAGCWIGARWLDERPRALALLSGSIAFALAWWAGVIWSQASSHATIGATAAVGSCLLLIAAAGVRHRFVRGDVAVQLASLGLVGVAAASLSVLAARIDPHASSLILAMGTGSIAIGMVIAAPSLPSTWIRESAAAIAVLTGVVLAVGWNLTPTDVVVFAAAASVAASVAAVLLHRIRSASPWPGPFGIAAVAANLTSFWAALGALPHTDLLEIVLLTTSVQCAAIGSILRQRHLIAASPLLALLAWLSFAADASTGEVQWLTLPLGLALLVVVEVERSEREPDPSTRPVWMATDYVAMAIAASPALVEIVTVSPLRGLVAVGVGGALGALGMVTRIRRRVLVGAGTVALALVLMIAVPIAGLVPSPSGPALWMLLAAGGGVLLVTATFLERGRSRIGRFVRLLEVHMEGWT